MSKMLMTAVNLNPVKANEFLAIVVKSMFLE